MNFKRYLERNQEREKQKQERKEAREKRKTEGILVHGAMKYRCEKCGHEWWMFLEKGLEDPAVHTQYRKPVPFVIACGMCGGFAEDVSGRMDIPSPEYYHELPKGESYFANKPDRDCGVPVLAAKDRSEARYVE